VSRAVAAGLFLLLAACASIRLQQPPVLSPFGDGEHWVVWRDMEFVVAADGEPAATIVVPRGFVTDLASTPKSIWSVYPPFGKYLAAAVLHDYLYWKQSCARDDTDKVFYQTMRDAGVDQATQSRFYLALAKEGQDAWTQNRAESAAGLVRVIPEAHLARPANVIWPEFRRSLRDANGQEAVRMSDRNLGKVCGLLANEIQVRTDASAIVLGR
jgi:hypothetical protein